MWPPRPGIVHHCITISSSCLSASNNSRRYINQQHTLSAAAAAGGAIITQVTGVAPGTGRAPENDLDVNVTAWISSSTSNADQRNERSIVRSVGRSMQMDLTAAESDTGS